MGQNDFLTKKRAAEIVGKSTSSYNNDLAIKQWLTSNFSDSGILSSAVTSYKATQFVEEKYWSKRNISSNTYNNVQVFIPKASLVSGLDINETDIYRGGIFGGDPKYRVGACVVDLEDSFNTPPYRLWGGNTSLPTFSSGYLFELTQIFAGGSASEPLDTQSLPFVTFPLNGTTITQNDNYKIVGTHQYGLLIFLDSYNNTVGFMINHTIFKSPTITIGTRDYITAIYTKKTNNNNDIPCYIGYDFNTSRSYYVSFTNSEYVNEEFARSYFD